MKAPLNILVIEDCQADFRLLERHLLQHMPTVRCHRVVNLADLKTAIEPGGWDLVLSDYSVPKLDFQETLALLQAGHLNLPLILVSGSLGEEKAVELLKLGVWDFVLKDNLTRLVPAIERSLRDAAERRARQAAEAALRVSEERLRLIGDNLPDSFVYQYTHEADGTPRFLYLSAGVERLHGVKMEAVLRDAGVLHRQTAPEQVPVLLAKEAESRQTLTDFAMEMCVQRPDGQQRWLQVCSRPRRKPDGQVVWDGVATDVTTRKCVEIELVESSRQRQLALNAARMGWWHYDPVTKICTWDDRFKEIFGVDGHQSPMNQLLACLHPDDLSRVWAAVEAALNPADPKPYSIEYRVNRSDGSMRWIEAHGLAGFAGEGAARHAASFVGTVADISERKDGEQALAGERNLLRTILDNLPDLVFTKDLEARVVLSNATAARFLAIPESQMAKKSVFDLNPADLAQAYQEDDLRVLRDGVTIYNREEQICDATGVRHWFLTTKAPLRDGEGRITGLVAICRNISGRKRLEQEKAAMEGQLRQQQKLESIGTLAAGVAHEINNPINGVMNYAQLIMDENAASPTTTEFAREIIHETERIATIVRNLLQFARQEKQSHSPAYLRDMIEQTLSLIRTVIRRDQITLQVELPNDLPTVKCRSQQIQQVLMNLLTNARDALNQRYPGYHEDKLIQLSCQPFEQENRRWVRITVNDHGAGIPTEVRDRVFDPFFTTKPRDVGTGLGLSISHGIVKDHHGKLWFETTPGQGTKFHVELPVDNGWEI